jgi:hypothetical protein
MHQLFDLISDHRLELSRIRDEGKGKQTGRIPLSELAFISGD